MTPTALPTLALLGLTLALLPAALAQEEPARPDDAAWVEDCPPDTMCAYEDSHGGALGPEGCIDCMTPPAQAESAEDPAPRNEVPAAPLAAALGILAVAAFAVALLAGGRRR